MQSVLSRYPSPFLHTLESMYLQVTSPHTTDSSIHFQLDFRPTPPTMTSHSPNRSTDPTLQVRIKQALEARFILFCQPTPNSFVILSTGLHEGTNSDIRDGDFKSPSSIRHSLTTAHQARKRYRIVIGPQACSCEETMEKVCRPVRNTDRALRPCVHVLFIMLRVLRTPVDDACLTQVPLPATKVEGLLQSYTNFKNTLNQRRAPEQKCHLALVPSTSEPKPITQSSNSSLTKPAKASSPPVPLAMPKPIYPLTKSQIPAPSEKTPHLLALVNATIQNSSECGELSSLTKGIMPVSRRREIESAGAVESSNTGTTVSRTSSSSDSTGSPRIRPPRRLGSMGDKYNSCWSAVAGTDSRRPRTAPQPDPPSCVGPRRIRSVRDGISATFRPIRDYSPTRLRENRLTPIKSEEVSADESLKYHLTCEISGEYESLRQAPDTKDISQSEPLPISGGFKHLHHGPFQPVAKKTSQPDRANGLAKTSNISNGAGTNSATKSPEDESLAILQSPSQFTGCVQRMCSLCLQNWEDCQGEKAERLVRCCATEILESSCVATFHFSCCKALIVSPSGLSVDDFTEVIFTCFKQTEGACEFLQTDLPGSGGLRKSPCLAVGHLPSSQPAYGGSKPQQAEDESSLSAKQIHSFHQTHDIINKILKERTEESVPSYGGEHPEEISFVDLIWCKGHVLQLWKQRVYNQRRKNELEAKDESNNQFLQVEIYHQAGNITRNSRAKAIKNCGQNLLIIKRTYGKERAKIRRV
ncbi:unnamed protein product [Calicophoron daubneyi]|uniref:SWIM-type domain-containing protein n=1 Tax=Calicophoron daubneyi TaxID=300641 RepID=A0AAV2T3V2_CALDB